MIFHEIDDSDELAFSKFHDFIIFQSSEVCLDDDLCQMTHEISRFQKGLKMLLFSICENRPYRCEGNF